MKTQHTPLFQFYEKYFHSPDNSQYSVTTTIGMRSLQIHDELFVNPDSDSNAPFIKGQFSYFVPDDIIVGKKVNGCNVAIITFVTKNLELVTFSIATASNSDWITINKIGSLEDDCFDIMLIETTTKQTVLSIFKEMCV